jgi:hypothetical protein
MKRILTFFILFIFSLNVFCQAPDWQWAKSIGGAYNDYASSVILDVSGNLYATGQFSDTVDFDPGVGVFNLISITTDAFITKLNNSGNLIWAKRIGGSFPDLAFGESVIVDTTNNQIYLAGMFKGTADFDPGSAVYNLTSAGNLDIFICKLDSAGNFQWAKQIGGIDDDRVASMSIDLSGNIYLGGNFSGTADFDPGVGTFNLTSSSYSDIFICKINSGGNFKWVKAMGSANGNGNANSISIGSLNKVYITGHFSDTVDFNPGPGVFSLISAGYEDVFISNLDSSGNFIWAKRIGGASDDYSESIAVDWSGSGSIYTTGHFSGTVDFDPGPGIFNLTSQASGDAFISKLSSTGSLLWAKQIGGTAYVWGDCIRLGTADLYLLGDFEGTADLNPGTGTFNVTSSGENHIFISKLDATGNFSWARANGGSGTEIAWSMALDLSENIYTAGYFESSSIAFGSTTITNTDTNSFDIFIAKLDTAIVGINETENSISSIVFYPNPFSEFATLTLQANNFFEGTIEIRNIFGVSVSPPKHFSGNTIQFQRNNLPAGIYFYTITTKANQILNGKFIID